MKKTIFMVTLFACLIVSGCNATQNTEEMAALQSQVEELQKQLDSLQPQPGAPPAAETDSATSTAEEKPLARAETSEQAAEQSPMAGSTADSYDIAALETAVNSIVEKVSAATVSADARTNRTTFWELHNELESVDNQLDQMDDLIEADFRKGILSRSDYLELDRQLDALDDRLGRAEDTLEFTFGVDD